MRRRAGLAHTQIRSLAAAALALLLTAGSARAQNVIYLIRHAEPSMTDVDDRHLNLAGQERAHAMRHLLEFAGITRVFSTDFNRARETVAPLAEALGLAVELYNPRALESFAATLKRTPGRIVVAGHSNTTPALVGLMGGDPGDPIDESYEFDRLYQLVIGSDGSVTTTLLRYGPVSGR